MQRGLMLFAGGSVVSVALFALLVFVLKDQLGDYAGLVFIPAAAAPFLLAYAGHRASGAIGNPFKGLVWGNTSTYFLIWFVAVLAGALASVLPAAIGTARFDPEMSSYVEQVITAAEKKGTSIEAEQAGMFKISGYVTIAAAPTFGALFGALLICLSTFPWFGWFSRRLLPGGTARTCGVLLVLFFLTGLAMGLVPNPQYGDLSLGLVCLLLGIGSAATVPALLWVFLRTRSAVLPAMAQGSFQGGLGALIPLLSDSDPLYGPPLGLSVIVVTAAIGLALWVWKDPGGRSLAVAAVAHDGTPLTLEQLQALDGVVSAPDSGSHATAGGALAPPPPPLAASAGEPVAPAPRLGTDVPLLDEVEGIAPPPE